MVSIILEGKTANLWTFCRTRVILPKMRDNGWVDKTYVAKTLSVIYDD